MVITDTHLDNIMSSHGLSFPTKNPQCSHLSNQKNVLVQDTRYANTGKHRCQHLDMKFNDNKNEQSFDHSRNKLFVYLWAEGHHSAFDSNF